MSLVRDVIKDSVEIRQLWTGETVTHQRTGKQFVAEYEESQNAELAQELGRDPRETGKIYVSDRAASEMLLNNDIISINFYGMASKFRVLSRTDNPGSVQVEFSIQKITAKDSA